MAGMKTERQVQSVVQRLHNGKLPEIHTLRHLGKIVHIWNVQACHEWEQWIKT